MLPFVYDLTYQEVEGYFCDLNEPSYRARQFWTGLYQHLWNSPSQFTTFSKTLRGIISEELRFQSLQPVRQITSRDGFTRKDLFNLPDQHAVESVLMSYPLENRPDRFTTCISSQVGCAMGCVFCATGQMGFQRNLSSGEIIAQVLFYARILSEEGRSLTNIVLMGMGEPFHNYQATLAAVRRLNDPQGFNFGARRFTISTVGIVPGIQALAEEDLQVNLAVSLHSVDNQQRSAMMPISKRYPLDELLSACHYFVEKTNRRVTFEWALIRDENDSRDDAKHLASWIGDLLAHVNIIPLNPTRGYSGQPASLSRAEAFQQVLLDHGLDCTIRQRRGVEIQAGCGQLASQDKNQA